MMLWAVGLASIALITTARADCGDLVWPHGTAPTTMRALTPDDLVRLRDVGPANNELPDRHLFSLSPDGRTMAFQIRRAQPETNSYCLGMIVLGLSPNARPIIVDRGGELLQYSARIEGQPGRDTGIPMVITPQWSRDGHWIAFLKRIEGVTQLWRAWADGHGSAPLIATDQDVIGFRIVDSSHILVRVQNRPGEDIDPREALRGYHYDGRFFPAASSAPLLSTPSGGRNLVLDIATGGLEAAADGGPFSWAENGRDIQADFRGRRVQLVRVGSGVPETRVVEITDRGGRRVACPQSLCGKPIGPIWWRADGRAIRFLQRAGWGGGGTAVAEWRPGSPRLRTLYASEDLLIDCQALESGDPVCLRETSTQPRHLVILDLAHHAARTIADFNPEFRALTLGRAQRLHLQSSAGIKTFADVVFPVGYQRDHAYPLIVVQYRSRGFLRGGVGDEFPIQAYANQGYAVLSVERPDPVGTLAHPQDYVEVDRLGLAGFADRWNVLSVVEQGVRKLVADGVADPRAVGITGLSDGTSTVQFAAIHSRLFAAGAVSDCCWEPDEDALLGPAAQTLYRKVGWPGIIDNAPDFWSQISLIQNARSVAFPILFDQPDDEFRVGLSSYEALREAHRPADLFVFPDEHHVKWQPAHRLAAYQRSIDWFNFWLRGVFPVDPVAREEAERWQFMKNEARAH